MIRPNSLTLVKNAMTHTVIGVTPSMSVADALELARDRGVSHLPVVDQGKPLGVVCTCDLEDASLKTDVSAIMHAPPVGVTPEETLAEAATSMASSGVGSLLVLKGSELVGILTRSEIEQAGLAEAAFGERRCSSCGTFHHVKLDERCGYWLCTGCRNRARGGDKGELGQGD
jgi:predicted transcriptional regulator